MSADLGTILVPLPIALIVLLTRPSLRYLILLAGLIVAVRGTRGVERVQAYAALTRALTPTLHHVRAGKQP